MMIGQVAKHFPSSEDRRVRRIDNLRSELGT
jgi:hypothetical protein